MPDATVSIAGRQHYFWALLNLWPEVLDSLRVEVSSVFRPRWVQGDFGQRVVINESWETIKSDPDRQEFVSVLQRWADRFRITEDWILEAAVDTLLRYSPQPPLWSTNEGEQWLWRYSPRGFHPVFEPTLDQNYWYPPKAGWLEEWDAFRRRMETQFGSQLAEYRRMVELRFGIGRERLHRDAHWTVRYQRGIPALEIAVGLTGYVDPEQTVYRAVDRFAKSIGLVLRKNSTRRTGSQG